MAGLFFGGIKMSAGRRQHVKRLEHRIGSGVELSKIGIDFELIWGVNWLMQEQRKERLQSRENGILISTLHGEVNWRNLYQSSVRPHGPHVA